MKLKQPIEIMRNLSWIETQKVQAVLFIMFKDAEIGVLALQSEAADYFYAVYLYDKLPKAKLAELRLIVQTVVTTIRAF